MKLNSQGQVLPVVMACLVLLLMIIAGLVNWVQRDTTAAVRNQRTTTAANFAEAGVDRAVWILQSSTYTWSRAVSGLPLTGYNFDVKYSDVPGGTYRIRVTSGPANYQATILAEGRDSLTRETRAIQLVVQNQTIPGPILTTGQINDGGTFEIHWGPEVAQGNIVLSGGALDRYFPRKFSKGVVSGNSSYPRDVNGLAPPNTDNIEWWSSYPVSSLPQLDFTTLRSSAASNGTLNYYNGFSSSHTFTGYTGGGHSCNTAGTSSAHSNPHNTHFADCNHHPRSKQNLIWYWDGDVVFTGGANLSGHGNGLYGTIIVRGNMTIETEDNYTYTAPIPSNAWMEYQRFDTASSNQYPGDNGYHTNRATFGMGSETWTGGPASTSYTDVGFRGFIYVGGNFTIANDALSDYAGALWVVGNATNNNTGEFSLLFYDPTVAATLPTLNVVLSRQSWKEVAPSTIAWP